ncbi:hypothetical protein SBI67_23350 [Mycolicibacterium sp. 120266]|jgi:Mce-associated membrane protein|uniref:hypothetical protein n=1 Tax=Mycolicibacterium sp. 120266 TaxID=3090601 RepID=UPI00299DA6B5|nr:hypothetical protein [Mycolicibacterium sp. 120266]MDX1875064.1 hypothetical protein [Mycolicibacterium sp. 120266]
MPAVEMTDMMTDETPDELDESPSAHTPVPEKRSLVRGLAFVVLPVIVIALGGVCGWLKWVDGSSRAAQGAATESVQVARDATIALLSYQPDTVGQSLEAAQSRLTGAFRDSYGKLIHDVVIPGSREKKISSIANIAAAASISSTATHAEVLVFVNQTSIVGADAPTDTASAVRVGLDRIDGHWLVASFDPV